MFAKRVFQPLFIKVREGDNMLVRHNENAAVNVVREKIGDEHGLTPLHPPFRNQGLRKLRRVCGPVLGAERAEALYLRPLIHFQIKGLLFYGAYVGEVACPARKRIEADLESLDVGLEALAGIEENTL